MKYLHIYKPYLSDANVISGIQLSCGPWGLGHSSHGKFRRHITHVSSMTFELKTPTMTFELSSKMTVDRSRLRLYRIISNEDLARIGSKLTRWRTVTPYLGLSTAQHEAIENDHRLTEEQRLDSHNLL